MSQHDGRSVNGRIHSHQNQIREVAEGIEPDQAKSFARRNPIYLKHQGFNDLVSGFAGVAVFLGGFSVFSIDATPSGTGRESTISRVPVLYFIPPFTLS